MPVEAGHGSTNILDESCGRSAGRAEVEPIVPDHDHVRVRSAGRFQQEADLVERLTDLSFHVGLFVFDLGRRSSEFFPSARIAGE